MGLYTHNQENDKKYTVKAKEEDYSETNPRSRGEFAEEFIRAYDGALKRIMRRERSETNIHEKIKEWKKLAEEINIDEQDV